MKTEKVIRLEVQKTAKGWMVQWYSQEGRLGCRVFKRRNRAAKFGRRVLTEAKGGQGKVRHMAAQ